MIDRKIGEPFLPLFSYFGGKRGIFVYRKRKCYRPAVRINIIKGSVILFLLLLLLSLSPCTVGISGRRTNGDFRVEQREGGDDFALFLTQLRSHSRSRERLETRELSEIVSVLL